MQTFFYIKYYLVDKIDDVVHFNKIISAYINDLTLVGSYTFNNIDVDVYDMPINWDTVYKNKKDYNASFNGKYLYYTKCKNMLHVEPHLQKLGLEVF